ncbi:MAG: hypothetical protein AAF570_14120 [Bacteroidota bacterium]
MKFFQTLAFCAVILFAATSCEKEVISPEAQQTDLTAKVAPTDISDNDIQNAMSSCVIVGSPQQMVYWETDMATVLDQCHEEVPGPTCSYWGNYTIQKQHDYSFPVNAVYSGTDATTWVGVIADNAQNDKPTPNGNWIVDDIQWQRVFTCPWGYHCFRANITYRRVICQKKNKLR